MPGSSHEIFENVQQITNTADQSSTLQAFYESKNSEEPDTYNQISGHTDEALNYQLKLLNNERKNMDNYNELPVDAVNSVNSEPWPTESEKADTSAEKVLPIDAQLKSSTKINYPDEFPNNEELIVNERSQAPFDFDKHMQYVITNHESIPHSLTSSIKSTKQDVPEDSVSVEINSTQ